MADRVRKILFRDKDIPLYFTALLGVLAFIYYPTFFNAPRSDWWETLYFFHTIYASPLPFQWLNILNTDCILHVSFRPLSHLVLYLQHSLFGANFFCIHLINFFLYFLSLVLLYKLATAFVSQKLLVFIAVVFFSLLYSHFDIVSWTAHSYLILGFCLLLLGFLFYIRFLNTGLKRMLFLTVFLLLSGMLCYEAFIFWPLAVVFLAYTGSLIKGRQLTNARAGLSWILVIAVTYFFYILIFLLTRSINTYADSGAQTHTLIFQLVSIPRIYRTVLAVFFDILYNGILVNIVPLFAYPPRISFPSFNLLLGGFLSSHRPAIIDMQILSGILLLIICWFIVYLSRRRKFDIIKSFLFFFFLLLTFSGTVFISKYYTNREYAYSLFQFRYHFVPSALIMLIASLFFERLGKLNKKIKAILCIILVLITALNVYCITSSILLESRQMATLNDMIVNIKRGISSKQINEKDRVYLDNRMVNILPKMCWNPIIGRFMKGTYQWMFNKKEIKYFSNSPESATWFINPRDFNLTKQLPQGIFGESNKVGLNEDIQVISFIQCEDYIDLASRKDIY
ncbi:MAG: hypothetical protein NT014_05620 [Candidatus Omnitrophica bacterium]|nr:hypothetical protein [Candidatus Omnitrophota bacterium]